LGKNETGNGESPLTHLRPEGGVVMVDVSAKPETKREAIARGRVFMRPETLELIAQGKIPKGDVLTTAQIAGIMGAKRTWELIPLCHILNLGGVEVGLSIDTDKSAVEIEAKIHLDGKTGAEMEALTAVSLAALAVYDMCKAVDKAMVISDIRLIRKSGGKSGTFVREGENS